MKTVRHSARSLALMRIDGDAVKRECSKCHEIKALGEFYVDGHGYMRINCKACDRVTMRSWQDARRKVGGCIKCNTPALPGRSECAGCMKKDADRCASRRGIMRRRAVEYLGGICVDCETRFDDIEVYDFHHVDPATKDHDIADGAKWMALTWSRVVKELQKCVLLCANCHRIRHARERAGRSITPSFGVPVQPRTEA